MSFLYTWLYVIIITSYVIVVVIIASLKTKIYKVDLAGCSMLQCII